MNKIKFYQKFTVTNKKYFILFSLLLLFLTFFLYLGWNKTKSTNENQPPIYTYDNNQIEKFVYDIDKKGADITYQQLKQKSFNMPYTTQHKIAHLFGKALYRAKKDEGISICDTNLSYGCYHGLLIEAINTGGPSTVSKLDHACEVAGKDIYPACQHGIGHGLVEYFGRSQIPKALTYCKTIQKNLLTGCSAGVFMEYFLPSAMNKDSISVVPIDSNDPFKICNSIETEFINSCIYEIPRVWRRTEPNLQRLSDRCATLGDPVHQKSCFRGLGYTTGDTAHPRPEVSLSVCSKTPNDQTKLYCLSGATWFYTFLDQTELVKTAINTLCKNSVNESECRQLSNLNLDPI